LLLHDRAELGDVVRDATEALRMRGLHVHEHVRRGDPALVLADVADEENARLIVVGAGGRGKIARPLIGSVLTLWPSAHRAPC
jgi:nucleotide-binding universal stress UspA family protein